MKLLKPVLAAVLTLSLVLTLASATQANAEDKVDTPILISTNPNAVKVELNLTQAQMGIGTKMKLCLTGVSGVKAKWESSNTKVVWVSKWGWLKAVEPGKAVVSAVYQGKTYKCTVTVSSKSVTPTVALCDYKNIHVSEQESQEDLSDLICDIMMKESTFYNLTEEDYNKAVEDYLFAFESLVPFITGCSKEEFYAILGGEGAREELQDALEAQKEQLCKQSMMFTEVANKEDLAITPDTLIDKLKGMINDPLIQIDYDAYVAELEKVPGAVQCICRYLSAEIGSNFVIEHVIVDGRED